LLADHAVGATRLVSNSNVDKTSRKDDEEALQRPSTPMSRDESYSATFQSLSHMDNDVVNDRVGNAGDDDRGVCLTFK